MNHYEKLAIVTAIEAIESQLKGVKTLLAAATGSAPAARAASPALRPVEPQGFDPHSYDLPPEDEAALEKAMKESQRRMDEQRAAIAKMAAETHSDLWADEARRRGLAAKSIEEMAAENAAAAGDGVPV